MKYTADTKPGMADPYWYEWSVGQSYLVDMLNPDSHIKCVELQANVQLGLDDVVITYDDEKTRFIVFCKPLCIFIFCNKQTFEGSCKILIF